MPESVTSSVLRVEHEPREWFEGGDRYYVIAPGGGRVALAPEKETADWIAAHLPPELWSTE